MNARRKKPPSILETRIEGRLKGVLLAGFAVLLVGVAGLLVSLQPAMVLHCARSPEHGETCSVEYRVAGVYTVGAQTFFGISSVETEEKIQESRNEEIGSSTTFSLLRYTRLVIQSASGRIETAWIAYPLGHSCATIQARLSAFKAARPEDGLMVWQTEAATTVLGAALLILSAFTVRSALGQLRRPVTVS
jgi:hypothetical protein